jgi:hypothetical protein
MSPEVCEMNAPCVFITAVPIIKLLAWGEGDSGGHVLRETTSRGLCGLVCPSRTSERWGEGDCVKEGGQEKGRARGIVHWGCYYATALDMEVDPRRRCFPPCPEAVVAVEAYMDSTAAILGEGYVVCVYWIRVYTYVCTGYAYIRIQCRQRTPWRSVFVPQLGCTRCV